MRSSFPTFDGDAVERQFEDRLVERIIDTLRESGPGRAFVGCEVYFEVAGSVGLYGRGQHRAVRGADGCRREGGDVAQGRW